jgi:hypothetical protein
MVEQRQKVDAFISSAAGPLDVTLVAPLPVPVTIPTPVEVCGEGGAGDPVLVEGIVGGVPVPVTIPTPVEVCGEGGAGDPVLVEGIAGGVPVPVTIPTPVEVCGEGGAGDPVLVEGIAGGVPVPVSVVPGAPVVESHANINVPVSPHYIMAWEIDAQTIVPGRIIFGIDNLAAGGGTGVEDINIYIDIEVIDGIRQLLYAFPAPTLVIPAGEFHVFEIDSPLSGVKLDLSQVRRVFLSMDGAGANVCRLSFVRCNGECTITWDGTVY